MISVKVNCRRANINNIHEKCFFFFIFIFTRVNFHLKILNYPEKSASHKDFNVFGKRGGEGEGERLGMKRAGLAMLGTRMIAKKKKIH